MSTPYPPYPPVAPGCYRHPDRPTMVRCVRCGNPVCPECMRSAAVGHQCADCVAAAMQSAPPLVGGPVRARTGVPVVSYALIAANVVVYVMQMARPALDRQLALIPLAVAGGDYIRLVSSVFMHSGVVHILFNMWALYVLGPPLEQHLGRVRFALLYGLSALGGSVMVYLFSPVNVGTVGASGAIFGLFGATLIAAKRLNLDVGWLIGLIVINLVITFTVPGISWQGHVGGLLTGLLVGAAFVYPRPDRRTAVAAATAAGLLVVFAALIVMRTSTIIDAVSAITR